MKFTLINKNKSARRGRLEFDRGNVETPAFMPVGTYGTVKAMTPEELEGMGAQIILGNTFHLMLRPGTEIIKKHGDLHNFTHWQGPILTDSGGFQVFSLAKMRKITEQGVVFQSPIDGAKVELTPESSMQVQKDLGSDIVMIFDECTPYPATETEASDSMELSLRWAERCKTAHQGNPNALFGIVQGGMYPSLRHRSAAELTRIGFDGCAIGGLSVGNPKMTATVFWMKPCQCYRKTSPVTLWVWGHRATLSKRCAAALICSTASFLRAMPAPVFYTHAGIVKIRNSKYTDDIRPWTNTATATPAKITAVPIFGIWISAAKSWAYA